MLAQAFLEFRSRPNGDELVCIEQYEPVGVASDRELMRQRGHKEGLLVRRLDEVVDMEAVVVMGELVQPLTGAIVRAMVDDDRSVAERSHVTRECADHVNLVADHRHERDLQLRTSWCGRRTEG